MFQIRRGEQKDIDGIMACYESARSYMRASGNFAQWINGYPSRNLVLNDISSGISYVGEDADGQIVAAFVFIIGEDPTYAVIEDGAWPNDLPYGTIHRLGSTGKYKGVLEACVKFCLNIIQNIRLDTHRDNFVMKRAVARLGFERCGIIYCIDGTERIAYQKSVGL